MSEATADERSILEDLTKHEGWRWLHAYAKRTYDDRLADYVEGIANENDPLKVDDKLRQLAAARRAVRQLLAAPKERLAQLQPKEPSLSRRGGL